MIVLLTIHQIPQKERDIENHTIILTCSPASGGFREGLARAGGFTCIGHCEIDKKANQSYEALFDTKGEWFCEDIRKAAPNGIPDFDLLCGGFPCQSFSIAGHRGGFDDPRGTLFFEIARLTEAKRPAYLLLENVSYVLKCIRYIFK